MTKIIRTENALSVAQILSALDRGITIEENLYAATVDVTDTGAANVEFTVTHNLGKVPVYYLWNINKNGVIYDSNRAAWTDRVMKLKCSAANAAVKLVVL